MALGAIALTTAALGQAVVPLDLAKEREPLAPASTVEELQSRYEGVLGALKSPPTSGVLVVELGPESAGGAGGLRPGDVIIEYDGKRLDRPAEKDRLAVLRAAATATAEEKLNPRSNPMTLLTVFRNGRSVGLQVERGALGVGAVGVEKGQAKPGNPPESPRGSFAMTWAGAAGSFHVGDGDEIYGAEHRTLTVSGADAALTIDARSAGPKSQELHHAMITYTATDRRESFAFALEALDYRDELTDIHAERRGKTIKATNRRRISGVQQTMERPVLPEAVPALAVPELAAALPQEAGIVLPLAQISEVDLQTRPGYALETLGKTKVSLFGQDTPAFGVRLWHFGQAAGTFYFAPDRTLLKAVYDSGVTLERAASAAAADLGIVPTGPKTQPASAPAQTRTSPGKD